MSVKVERGMNMRRFFCGFFAMAVVAVFAAGCITSDSGSNNDDGTNEPSNNDAEGTFSEQVSARYAKYLSDCDSISSETDARLADIYSAYCVRKSAINQTFFTALIDAFNAESASISSVGKIASDEDLINDVLEAEGEYSTSSNEAGGDAVDEVNNLLEEKQSEQENLDSDLQSDVESMMENAEDDGSSVYDDLQDSMGDDGGSSDDQAADVLRDEFGSGDSGSGDSALDQVNDMLEDYNNAGDQQSQNDAANDVLDQLGDYLDQGGPEGESDARSIEDTINDFIEGEASRAETLDFIENLLLNGDGGGLEFPSGIQSIVIDISYVETMDITEDGLDTHAEDVTSGSLILLLDVPPDSRNYDFDVQDDITYHDEGTDNVTESSWVSDGTATVKASGSIFVNDAGNPAIHVDFVFNYTFNTVFTYPVIGNMTLPGSKSEFSDMVEMEYRDGEIYENIQDYGSTKLVKRIVLHIGN